MSDEHAPEQRHEDGQERPDKGPGPRENADDTTQSDAGLTGSPDHMATQTHRPAEDDAAE